MQNRTIDDIAENLFHILPIIHKKLLRINLGDVSANLSRLHFAIMAMLAEESLPVSEIARRLLVPKSQMTRLVDQLAGLGILERQSDTKDRRVINVLLTDHGKIVLRECRDLMRQNIRNKLSCLTPGELADLSVALRALRDIGSRLE